MDSAGKSETLVKTKALNLVKQKGTGKKNIPQVINSFPFKGKQAR